MINNYLWLLLILLNISCKPYKAIKKAPNQTTYSEFKAQQKTFESENGAIHYIDKGQGDVIVLLHGVPTSGWLYRHMIDELAQSHRVIVPDMLGFGASASPDGYELYSEVAHANRLLALLNHLKIQNWTHVMHDAGGLWTWELFKKEPNRIENLVILNTIIYNAGFTPPIKLKKGFFARTAMWSYSNGVTTNLMLKGLFNTGLTKNTLNKIDVEGYKEPLKSGKTKGMYYFFSQNCNNLTDYKNTLLKINIPVAVIWGKTDSFLQWEPQKEAVIKHLKISSSNIHLLDAKHFIQEEKPKEINKIILNFLK